MTRRRSGRRNLAQDIGEDCIRWAQSLYGVDEPMTADELERFAEAIANSSIPEACNQIADAIRGTR